MNTEYGKIETLFERDMEPGSPTRGKLLEPLRFKNPTYESLGKLEWTEKIDGTNIRVDWNPAGRNPYPEGQSQFLWYGGKTDRAVLPGPLSKWLETNLNVDLMGRRFSSEAVTLYGEGYGAGIQKGGGYRPDQAFILFDVFVHDTKSLPTFYTPSSGNDHWMQGWWMPRHMVEEVATVLGIEAVPFLFSGTIMNVAAYVRSGQNSTVAKWHGKNDTVAEGLVGRPAHTLYNSRGGRIIAKIKTSDFAPRQGVVAGATTSIHDPQTTVVPGTNIKFTSGVPGSFGGYCFD